MTGLRSIVAVTGAALACSAPAMADPDLDLGLRISLGSGVRISFGDSYCPPAPCPPPQPRCQTVVRYRTETVWVDEPRTEWYYDSCGRRQCRTVMVRVCKTIQVPYTETICHSGCRVHGHGSSHGSFGAQGSLRIGHDSGRFDNRRHGNDRPTRDWYDRGQHGGNRWDDDQPSWRRQSRDRDGWTQRGESSTGGGIRGRGQEHGNRGTDRDDDER